MLQPLADIVLPFFWERDVMGLPVPVFGVAALVAEAAVFCVIEFRAGPLWSLILAVITAIVVSTGAGFFLWTRGSSNPSVPGLILAWAVSVGIEYAVYLCVPPWRRLPHLLRAVVLSNLASYAIFFVVLKIL